MYHVVLYQPEIPPNTGNIIRLCANTGSELHLVQPLGFTVSDARLRRAGLDYLEWAKIRQYINYEVLQRSLQGHRIFACTTKAQQSYAAVSYLPGDVFLFGPETRGLPDSLLQTFPEDQKIRIPMQKESRSINLSNAVAIIVYEAWRQQEFMGSK